jgi:hypothetical protein
VVAVGDAVGVLVSGVLNANAVTALPSGTSTCPGPAAGAAKAFGVWDSGAENNWSPVFGLKPRSSGLPLLAPRSRFHSTPPTRMGGLDACVPL